MDPVNTCNCFDETIPYSRLKAHGKDESLYMFRPLTQYTYENMKYMIFIDIEYIKFMNILYMISINIYDEDLLTLL